MSLEQKRFLAAAEKWAAILNNDVAAGLRNLAKDARAESVWRAFGQSTETTEFFLADLLSTLDEASFAAELRVEVDQLIDNMIEIDRACEILEKYCERTLKADLAEVSRPWVDEGAKFIGGNLDDTIKQLRWLRWFSNIDVDRDLLTLEPLLPKSQKWKTKTFLVRVHFGRLLVEKVLARLGRPYYQQVADAVSAFFDLSVEMQLSATDVRNAWRKHGRGGGVDNETLLQALTLAEDRGWERAAERVRRAVHSKA